MPDGSATLLPDRHPPSSNGSALNNHYQITDADLAALFLSPTGVNREDEAGCMETFDTALLSQINELVDAPEHEPVGPPPGFEHLHFDATALDTSATLSLISDLTLQSQVSPSDQICSSQLLFAGKETDHFPSPFLLCRPHFRWITTTTDRRHIRWSIDLSSNLSIASDRSLIRQHNDEQHSRQTAHVQESFIQRQTIRIDHHQSRIHRNRRCRSRTGSAVLVVQLIPERRTHKFVNTSSTSLITRSSLRLDTPPEQLPPSTRQSSSSNSSSGSSSIDDALIQLNQQHAAAAAVTPKLFQDKSLSIFQLPASQTAMAMDSQQRAMHDNISLLASLATTATPLIPDTPWPSSRLEPKLNNPPRPMQHASHPPAIDLHSLMENLNELCYRGFDELNTLVQEQRWVRFFRR